MKKENHLKHNLELERRIDKILDSNGHINGQGRYPVGMMKFGHVSAGFASCELIAVYNVLKDAGIFKPFSEIIYDAERLGFLFAGGYFGTKITKIGKLLELYGIKSRYIKLKDFYSLEKQQNSSSGDTFIAVIRTNKKLPVAPLHTFEMTYSEDGRWTVYNRFNGDNHPSIYENLDDILNNGPKKGAYYRVFRVLL